MYLAFYTIFIYLYRLGIGIASLWNEKAANWINGRKNGWKSLSGHISEQDRTIWIHASSAGEFEQAKPVIGRLKKEYPNHKILVSFFSPSGFSAAKNYEQADLLFYLPLDTAKNATKLLDIIHPEMVIFVKYDFWYYFLYAIHSRKIPLLLISASFRQSQAFFRPYGKFYRRMLFFFNYIFVQNDLSRYLLNNIGVDHCSVSGDTRFDRVIEITGNTSGIPVVEDFLQGNQCVIAGSTWEEDEEKLKCIKETGLKLIIAPHEINENHIRAILKKYPDAIRYSQYQKGPDSQTLIIDNVGMLSKLYGYATLAYIGGGFTKDGVHNVLEAAVYGKPVLYGNNYQKYKEALDLVNVEAAYSFSSEDELKTIVLKLMNDPALRKTTGERAKEYVFSNTGAAEKIMNLIQEKRLLTNW